jgi:hypothetical protein
MILVLALGFEQTHAATNRVNRLITVTSGTPVRISSVVPSLATELFVQMAAGGSGKGYVMLGIPDGVTPSSSNAAQVTAELAPATSTAPGGSLTDAPPQGLDVSQAWVDGSNSGDTIRVSYLLKI